MLWVDDVKANVNYYVNFLQFEEANVIEEWGWAVVEKDKLQIMFTRPNEHTPYKGPRFTGSIST